MVDLHGLRGRLGGFVFVLLVLLAAVLAPKEAGAVVTKTQYCNATNNPCGVDLGWFDSKSAACQARVAWAHTQTSPVTGYKFYWDDPTCSFCISGAGGNTYCTTGPGGTNPTQNVPYGTRLIEEQCQTPYVEVNGECVDPCSLKAGDDAGNWSQQTNMPATGPAPALTPRYICVPETAGAGCLIQMQPTFGAGVNGMWSLSGAATYTGSACDPAQDGSGSSPTDPVSDQEPGTGDGVDPGQCPIGKVPGTVNGVAVCVTPGVDSPTVTQPGPREETTQNSDGSTTEKETTSTTICTGQSCTTTTTVNVTNSTPGGGTPTNSVTTTVTTCQKGTPDCPPGSGGGGGNGDGEGSAFSGACSAGFACEGDAIMCAIAQEQHRRDCTLFDKTDVPEAQLYEQSKAATSATGMATSTVAITQASFDQTSPIGSGACIPDLTVTVAGQTVTLPFSAPCDQLAVLGNIMLAFAFLVAIRIVGRG